MRVQRLMLARSIGGQISFGFLTSGKQRLAMSGLTKNIEELNHTMHRFKGAHSIIGEMQTRWIRLKELHVQISAEYKKTSYHVLKIDQSNGFERKILLLY